MANILILSLDVVALLIIISIILYIFKALIITKNNLFTANLYFFISIISLFLVQFINTLISFDIIPTNNLLELIRCIIRLIFLIFLMIGSYKYSKLLYDTADGLTKDRLKKKTKPSIK